MPTPYAPGYAELIGASSTLFIGSAAIRLTDAADLRSIGGSKGSNLPLGGVDGSLPRIHKRGELIATVGFQIVGALDQDGAPVANPVVNGLALQTLVKDFPDSQGRQFAVRYTEFSDITIAPAATFKEFGPWARPDDAVWYGSMILAIPAGVLVPPPPPPP